jgi:hypothetical protein
MRWDATRMIRRVCSRWLVWSTQYNFKEIREQHRSGHAQCADFETHRMSYPLYELIDRPRGATVLCKPRSNLKQTEQLLRAFLHIPQRIRRLSFYGFHAAETDDVILSIVASCSYLEYLAVPWNTLRRGTVEQWSRVLNTGTGFPRLDSGVVSHVDHVGPCRWR